MHEAMWSELIKYIIWRLGEKHDTFHSQIHEGNS